jgi:hypothetical protein
MQVEYVHFGDVVTFDKTHKTNLYDKPLGMFFGANHYLHCTFEWAFNAFKTCMSCEGP